MSASDDLNAWVTEHRPELLAVLTAPAEYGIHRLNRETGLKLSMRDFVEHGPDYVCAMWLAAFESALPEPPKPEAAPKKPPPSLPVEAWATREFDAEQAHAATMALCRGQ